METVMDNLRAGKVLGQDGAVGSVAVNANGADGLFLTVGEDGEKGFEALLLLALGHVQQLACQAVEDDRHVTVAFADGLLIDKQDLQSVQTGCGKIGVEDIHLIAAHRGLADGEHGGHRARRGERCPCGHRTHQPPGCVAGWMDFGRPGSDEHPALRAAPLDCGQRDPDRVPIGKGQIIDSDLPRTDFLEGYPAIRTARLAAAVAKHRDLHPDLFYQNLTHDASGKPEQLLDVERFHRHSPRPVPGASPP